MSNDVKVVSGIARQLAEPAAAGRAQAPAEAARAQTAPTGAGGADAVELTDRAAMLKQVETALEAVPVVDAGRVDQIRAALVDGSYRVDAERVADKLVRLEADLQRALSG